MIKKKIINFIPNFYFGGVEKTNITLSKELSKSGYEVELLTNNFLNNRLSKNNKHKIKSFNKKKMSNIILDLTKHIRKTKPDLIICSQFYANIIIIISCFISGYKNKLILCERVPINENLKKISFFKRIILKFMIKILYNKADLIICNSNGTKKELEKIVNGLNSVVIYNPVITDQIQMLSDEQINDFVFDKSIIHLITVSRISYEKNIKEMIDIVLQIPENIDFKLLIIGDGDQLDSLKSYAQSTKYTEKIIFMGYKSNPYKYLKNSDIYLSTAQFEGMGNSLVEALYFNLQVIAYNCPGGISEVLGNGKFGHLIEQHNKNQFIKILEQSMLNSNKSRFDKDLNSHLDLFLKMKVINKFINIIKQIEKQ
ncbi:MAG: hypothetical protein CL730_01520 [Chloroflexi bacterium]|nr:hypothetical protein [Chloroflexota bacterium]